VKEDQLITESGQPEL